MMSTGDKSDVLQLFLSRYHSLDVVRLPRARKYRVVFAERFGVQRRAFVEISFDEAARLALFLTNVENGLLVADENDPPTDPNRPSKLVPSEVRDIETNRQNREDLPEALPPIPRPPISVPQTPQTQSRNVTEDAVPRATFNSDDGDGGDNDD